ncbi:putative serine/arginine repetitive matrix protein 2-like isoform 2 [Scophthalmus maximus]|uniref:Putative serine/arginine repetitive matrix protein 2-like n=2 Tax=Scophthalmus maximus TaxID=52904 RepID=A0A2U9C8X8_SCOMX|nr:putative serine/arginine repetitive matrix protein 2-like [Scophthalmus maximus]AWP12984.1 putative serine/arginine repetitive matrix protein 2-like isoform 2 [Scophthalmus maximus]
MECAVDIPSGEDEVPEKDDMNAKEGNEPYHKKNKKHRKHKSKKKKRKRKGEKESSSESGAESDVEPQPPAKPVRNTRASARIAAATGAGDTAGLKEDSKRSVITDRVEMEGDAKSKKHKRHASKKKKKKKKKDEKQEKISPSHSQSESSSASGSESEAMPPLAPLPTITNKPPPCLAPPTPTLNLDHIEEAKRKVTQQANIHTIKELTEKCKMIANSKEEMAIAKPHVSDDES